jgi:hypothetical protein
MSTRFVRLGLTLLSVAAIAFAGGASIRGF